MFKKILRPYATARETSNPVAGTLPEEFGTNHGDNWGIGGASPAAFGVPPKTFSRGGKMPRCSQQNAAAPIGRNRTDATKTGAFPFFSESFQPSLILALAFLVLTGCRTLPPLPQADLSQTGWTVFTGQAIWQPKADAPEIAGELLVATNRNGNTFVQFTKTPFPLMIAQTTPSSWQIEAPVENRRFARTGSPPDRILWFQLPRALPGSPLKFPWRWTPRGDSWRLENVKSGECLDGFVEPQTNGQ